MFRLIDLFPLTIFAVLAACNPPSSARFEEESRKPHSLPELLHWHDVAVSQQGKDLYFLKPIGAFGREGVLASLAYIETKGETVSSYNNTELVFGVASEAKERAGYDICKDGETLKRIAEMARGSNVPEYQRRIQADLLHGLCKPS
jgi:hypothetical protein